jgi:hypothetical protein
MHTVCFPAIFIAPGAPISLVHPRTLFHSIGSWLNLDSGTRLLHDSMSSGCLRVQRFRIEHLYAIKIAGEAIVQVSQVSGKK